MVDVVRLQWVAWALVGLLVLGLGASRLGGGGAAGPEGRPPPPRARPAVRPAVAAGVVVDVAGAVRRPGVYRLRADGRVQDAVRRAGGPTRRAELSAINLAARLVDGAQILVPARGAPGAGLAAGAGPQPPVNLNTATVEQLDGLDGIGPTTAERIVEFRRAHGGFGSLRDLDRIPGIGPKRLAALRGKVVV